VIKAHFARNHRFRWAFRICEELGIDDPAHWMNCVDPTVLDSWIAYFTLKYEEEKAAFEKSQKGTHTDSKTALDSLMKQGRKK